jgi:hypothetical protein
MFCAEPKRNESHGAAHTGRLERDALADPGASDFLAKLFAPCCMAGHQLHRATFPAAVATSCAVRSRQLDA